MITKINEINQHYIEPSQQPISPYSAPHIATTQKHNVNNNNNNHVGTDLFDENNNQNQNQFMNNQINCIQNRSNSYSQIMYNDGDIQTFIQETIKMNSKHQNIVNDEDEDEDEEHMHTPLRLCMSLEKL
eukprot:UN05570